MHTNYKYTCKIFADKNTEGYLKSYKTNVMPIR